MDKEKTIWIGSGGSQTNENLTNLIKIHFCILIFFPKIYFYFCLQVQHYLQFQKIDIP